MIHHHAIDRDCLSTNFSQPRRNKVHHGKHPSLRHTVVCVPRIKLPRNIKLRMAGSRDTISFFASFSRISPFISKISSQIFHKAQPFFFSHTNKRADFALILYLHMIDISSRIHHFNEANEYSLQSVATGFFNDEDDAKSGTDISQQQELRQQNRVV